MNVEIVLIPGPAAFCGHCGKTSRIIFQLGPEHRFCPNCLCAERRDHLVALKPFAALFRSCIENPAYQHSDTLVFAIGNVEVTVGDLRRAHIAVAKATEEEKAG